MPRGDANKIRFTASTTRRIVRLCTSGKSYIGVARLLGCSAGPIYRVCKAAGLPLPGLRGRPRVHSKIMQLEKVLRTTSGKSSDVKIAQTLGMHPSLVFRTRTKLKLPPFSRRTSFGRDKTTLAYRIHRARSRSKITTPHALIESTYRGCCECCERPFGRWVKANIDHCHLTFIFRWWLCHHCNIAFGNLSKAFNWQQNETDKLMKLFPRLPLPPDLQKDLAKTKPLRSKSTKRKEDTNYAIAT